MDTKKSLDLAAGRLTKVPTRHGTPRPRSKKGSSYGTARLGITPEKERQEPEAVEAAPAPTAPPAKPEPARPEPAKKKPARPRPVVRRPDPAPAVVAVAGAMGLLRSLNFANLRAWVRRPWVLAAAIGVVATVAVACFALSGDPEAPLGPQTPARARAAVAPAPQARQARPPEPKTEPVPVAKEPIVPQLAQPVQVALDKPAPPARPATASLDRRLSASTDSLLPSWLKEVGDARPNVQPSPSEPAPTARPQEPKEPPKPEKAAAPAPPPTYDYVPCPPGFRFTGAVQCSNTAFANINGRFVPVGGEVGGATVVKINSSSAVLERDGKRFIVCYGMGDSAPAPQNESDDVQANKPPATTQPADKAGNSKD